MALQILLVDEHPETGVRLQAYLQDHLSRSISCSLFSARQLTDQADRHQPDFIIVDTSIKTRDWVDLCYDLNVWYPDTCTIIVSNNLANKFRTYNSIPGIYMVLDKTQDLDEICYVIEANSDQQSNFKKRA